MSLQEVAGFRVKHCRRRDGYYRYHTDKLEATTHNTLLLILKGKVHFSFGKTSLTAGKESIVCCGPGTLKEGLPVPGQPAAYVVLTFDMFSGEGKKIGFADIGFPSLIRVKSPGRILSMLQEIESTCSSGRKSRLTACAILGLQLLQTMEADRLRTTKQPPDASGLLHFRIKESVDYIHRNFKKRLDVAELAKRACMHPTYFAHLFKREIGVSPHQYVLDYKVEKAKEFLCTYDEALDYTANELGFHDYSHFYRTFKKATGKTPMRFVKENKGIYDPR